MFLVYKTYPVATEEPFYNIYSFLFFNFTLQMYVISVILTFLLRFHFVKSSTLTGLVWDINMAAVSLFWNINIFAIISFENVQSV